MFLSTRTATRIVAASDADERSRVEADYVCDGIADDIEIQAAIDALPNSGGKVVLSEGTFNIAEGAKVTVKSKLCLKGSGRGSTIIKSVSTLTNDKMIYGDSITQFTMSDLDVDMNSKTVRPLSLETTGQDITIERVRFINGMSHTQCIVFFVDISRLVITGCFFNKIQALALSTCQIVTITNNVLYTSYGDGIQCAGGCTNVDVIGNYVYDAPYGIAFGDGDSVRVIGNECSSMRDNGPGIYFEEFTGQATVSGNVVRDCTGNSGIYVNSLTATETVNEGVTITSNTILNCKIGITTKYAEKAVVSGNTISDCGNYGIAIEGNSDQGTDQVVVASNTIENTGTANSTLPAILLYYATNCNVYGNIIKGSSGQDYGIRELTSANNNMIHDNRIYNVDAGNEVVAIGASTRVYNNFPSHTIHSTNAGALPAYFSGQIALTTASGNETRTLAVPTFVGQELTLYLKTNSGTDCTVTCSTTINETGNNTILFNATGESLFLRAVEEGSNLRWRCAVADGVILSTV